MTHIRTRCPACFHEVALAVDDIDLLPASYRDAPRYAFTCPQCRIAAVKTADATVYRLLCAVARTVTASAATAHPESPPSGPAFTYDDVLDFHDVLSRTGWFSALMAVTPLPEGGPLGAG